MDAMKFQVNPIIREARDRDSLGPFNILAGLGLSDRKPKASTTRPKRM